MTEVNMNVATYLKFEHISNAQIDLRATAIPLSAGSPKPSLSQAGKASTLDASFDLSLALSNAIDKLDAQNTHQATPALGKFRDELSCRAAKSNKCQC